MNILTRKSKSGSAGDYGAPRIKYKRELIAERILGRAADHVVTRYMEEGSEREDAARSMYEAATRQMVLPVGFVLHPRFDWSGASPDGLVDGGGLVEIKSPKPETLLEQLDTGEIPKDYIFQMQWEMVCSERTSADYFCWYPGLPHFLRTVELDPELVGRMEEEAQKLNQEVEEALVRLGYKPAVWNDEPPAAPPVPDWLEESYLMASDL